jgi:hypothetical protein
MEIIKHEINHIQIAEIISDKIVIGSIQEGIDLVGNLYYMGFDRMIIHEKNIVSEFFDLKTGIAGEILQKFSNFRIRLAIIGDFDQYESKSLKEFILESNKNRQVNFLISSKDAILRLSE